MADVAVIGAGILGLTTARDLLIRHPNLGLVVLEKEPEVARHQSGRNSGVLHSGIYYQPGSLKATLCRSGAELMVQFCEDEGIKLEQSGKVVVVTAADQLPQLEALEARGKANGVTVRQVGPGELREIEPHAAGVAALHVPDTGAVEFGEVCRRLATDIKRRGGTIVTGAAVSAITEVSGRVRIEHQGGDVEARALVNCAGLHSDKLARLMGLTPDIQIIPFRGEYYELGGRSADLVRSAIYPLPDPRLPFLGVHLTRRATGVVEAGPNAVLAFAREGYAKTAVKLSELGETLAFPGTRKVMRRFWRVGLKEYRRSLSAKAFARSVQELVPEVNSQDMSPGTAGVRAQAVTADGRLVDDFVITRSERSLHVLNAPSPAATASLAIAADIGRQISAIL